MRLRGSMFVAALLPIVLATDAAACVVLTARPWVEGYNYDAKVIVRVTEALFPEGDHQWQARGRILRVVGGTASIYSVDFHMGDSGACQTEYPIPKVGDRWVVYLLLRDGKFVDVGSDPLRSVARER